MVEVKNTNANGAASFTCVTTDRWWRNEFEFFLGVWQFYPNVGILRQREGNIWSGCHRHSPSSQLLKVTSASFGCEWRLDAKSKNPSWLKMTSDVAEPSNAFCFWYISDMDRPHFTFCKIPHFAYSRCQHKKLVLWSFTVSPYKVGSSYFICLYAHHTCM